MAMKLTTRPVTSENWDDFDRLFSARGSPHFCWCTAYRFRALEKLNGDEKRAEMDALVTRKTPIGVLAYDGDDVVGWCSVAPRETYVKLERSRTMPRMSEAPTWTVLCFFVPRARRGTGITRALLAGAVSYARAAGAQIVEGYPFDTAGISSTHQGHSSVFRASGFTQDGRRWFLTL